MEREGPSPRSWPIAALLFALVLGLYWRTSSFEFLNYDDDVYVTENRGVRGGLDRASLRWAFSAGHAANWHPLTWLSHQLDVELFGLDAGAHHRTNALLHASNAALLFLALAALTGARGKSVLVAALFALHPLRVESVAWVAERKDLLAATLAFGCLWAYAGYAQRGGLARYGLCLALFALGLLAKPMLVTLPGVLLLLDVWPLGRVVFSNRLFSKPAARSPVPPSLTPTHPRGAGAEEPRKRFRYGLFLEKLPFFALAGASAVVTWLVQGAGGAFGPLDTVAFGARLANAVAAFGLYLAKTLVPLGLCVFHPHPALSAPSPPTWTPAVFLALAVVLGITSGCIWLRRRAPFALVGWLWFLGMLVPVIGLVQVGLQAWAERYTYLPSVGLSIALVWSLEALGAGRARQLALGLGPLVLAALAAKSWQQCGTWRDSRTLFEHALEVEESAVAHVNLGRALEEARDPAGAEAHYARALVLRPSLSGARVNLARVLRAQGRAEAARVELERVLTEEPGLAAAHSELGWLLAGLGLEAEALAHLRRAAELGPSDARRNDLAWVLATSRSSAAPEEARAMAEGLVRETRGAQAAYLETLAAALARLGRFEEALEWQARALERVPAAQRAPLAARLELYRARQPYLRSP